MKLRKTLLRTWLLLSVLAVTAASAPLVQDFLPAFEKALAAGDEAKMKELVLADQTGAAEAAVRTCVSIGEQSSEHLEKLYAALSKAWRAAFSTDFVDRQYEYFSLMRPEVRKAWSELHTAFVDERAKYEKAIAEHVARDLPPIGYEMEGYAKGFQEMGDLYHASEAWLMHAWCFEEQYLGENANLETSYNGFEQGIRLRHEVGLMDEALRRAEARKKVLDDAGVGEAGEFRGTVAGKARAEAEAAAAETVPLTFELAEDLEKVQRPYYCADAVFQMWPALALEGEGSKASFPYVDKGPSVYRTAFAAAAVDVDGDGEGEVEIPLTGKEEAVRITVGQGEDARPWAFLARIGQARDRYQGIDFNLESSAEQLQIYIAPAASLVGEVAGVPLRVYDDNMDAVYGSEPKFWASIGTIRTGAGQADVDSLLVGDEKVARPWSPVSRIGESWYRLAIDGTTLTATPITNMETGTLELDYKGLDPDYLLVQGNTKYGEAFFDLAGKDAKKGLEVPVGTYYLISGKVSKGKREQVMKALIVPPEKAKGWDLAQGENLTIELGAPFGFEFEVRQGSESATVVGSSVVVSGRGGETYQRLWNCVVTPDAVARKVGTKKGGKEVTMRTVQQQEDISEAETGYEVAWFPWDVELEKKKADEELEVQLSMKKHKLFGKIESEWRK